MKGVGLIGLFFFAQWFSGCGASDLYHPAKGGQEFYSDRKTCSAQASKESNRAYDGVSSIAIANRVYQDCMRSQGWRPKSQRENSK